MTTWCRSDMDYTIAETAKMQSDINAALGVRKNPNYSLFPITLRAAEYGGGHGTYTVISPSGFRDEFLANRPKDKTWYAYDVIITSPSDVTFRVYGMRDNARGGIGDFQYELDLVVDEATTAEHMKRHAMQLAVMRHQDELDAAEQLIIQSYADEILKAHT